MINSPFDICEIKQQERFMKFEIEYYRVYICVWFLFSFAVFTYFHFFCNCLFQKVIFTHNSCEERLYCMMYLCSLQCNAGLTVDLKQCLYVGG